MYIILVLLDWIDLRVEGALIIVELSPNWISYSQALLFFVELRMDRVVEALEFCRLVTEHRARRELRLVGSCCLLLSVS